MHCCGVGANGVMHVQAYRHSEAGTPRVAHRTGSASERGGGDPRAFHLGFRGAPLARIELHTPHEGPLYPGCTFSVTVDFRSTDGAARRRAACHQVQQPPPPPPAPPFLEPVLRHTLVAHEASSTCSDKGELSINFLCLSAVPHGVLLQRTSAAVQQFCHGGFSASTAEAAAPEATPFLAPCS